jgi:hypothetical protein
MLGEPPGARAKSLKIVAKKLAWMDWWGDHIARRPAPTKA